MHQQEDGTLRIIAPDLSGAWNPRTTTLTYTPAYECLRREVGAAPSTTLTTPSRPGKGGGAVGIACRGVSIDEWREIASATSPEEWAARVKEVEGRAKAEGRIMQCSAHAYREAQEL